MADNPANEGTVRSLWQSNSIALRVERFVNWTVLDDSVAYISDVHYLSGSPL